MSSKYEKTILTALLDKYEKSKSFTGDNKVNQKFVAKIATTFPKYTDHSNFEVFQGVNDAVDILVRKELVFAKISKANVCSEVSLHLDEVEKAYDYIGRPKKKEVNHSVLAIFEDYKEKNEILKGYCQVQAKRIRENKSIQFFNGDLEEFENILIAVYHLLKVETETFVRDFSVKVFKNSKLFEGISSKVVSLLYEYGDFPEKEQLLESINIVKNPTYVNFKGAGAIVLSGQRIDVSVLKGDIAISSTMLEDIESIEITGKEVMTVENLTSFHTANSEDVFSIYLGGFHNQIRRHFIKKIHQQNPNIEFYHFGDIDAGGFYILEHLKRSTGVDFKPYKMDVATLEKYQNYSKTLTKNDEERLKKLRGRSYDEVIDYMLENGCKLEQEAVEG